eukprot:g2427.t1
MPERGGRMRKHRFDVTIVQDDGSGGERILELAAKSADAKERWLEALSRCSPGVRRVLLADHPRAASMRRSHGAVVEAHIATEALQAERRAASARHARQESHIRRAVNKEKADALQAQALAEHVAAVREAEAGEAAARSEARLAAHAAATGEQHRRLHSAMNTATAAAASRREAGKTQ